MDNQLVQQLTQVALSALGLVGTYALAKLSMYLDEKKKAVVAVKGSDTYNHALEVAKGFYLLLEEEFKGIEKAGADKKDKMEVELLKLFPFIPKTELDGINKVVWNQLNDKIITPLLTEVEDTPTSKTTTIPAEVKPTIPDAVVVPETVVEPVITSETIITPTEKEVAVEAPIEAKSDVILGVIPTPEEVKPAEVKVDTNEEILAKIQALLTK